MIKGKIAKRNSIMFVIVTAALLFTISILMLERSTILSAYKATSLALATHKSAPPLVEHNVATLLNAAYETFKIPNYGIIHIGARNADELPIYMNKNIKDVLWIEADTTAENNLIKKVAQHSGSKVAIFAATNTNGNITLRTTSNDGYSSSILKLKNHVFMSPDVVEAREITVPQRRLDDYLRKNNNAKPVIYNTLVIDVQGAELIALQGAVRTLQHIDAIIAEVNFDDLYAGGVHVNSLDNFCKAQGFTRVASISVNRAYGDALYVKNRFCTFKQAI
jgi:FkbM family methyltransferase